MYDSLSNAIQPAKLSSAYSYSSASNSEQEDANKICNSSLEIRVSDY
jgi:hypothetical protein